MADDTILCREPEITVAMYRKMGEKQKGKIIKLVRNRFTERYITPVTAIPIKKRHGFCTIAICCLMIEALESFRQGWQDTSGRGASADAFRSFFDSNDNFKVFRGHATEFYKNIRCGILHQAETTGGWKILRQNSLFDPATKTINATKFHSELKRSLEAYCEALDNDDWNTDLWIKLRYKMIRICTNC